MRSHRDAKRWIKIGSVAAVAPALMVTGWLVWSPVVRWVGDYWMIFVLITAGLLLLFYTVLQASRSRQGHWALWWSTPIYIIVGVVAFALQEAYAPTWLVSTSAGVQTVLQSIPATVIALFILAFTTLFVVAQQIVTVFSNRAPLFLAQDDRVRRIVARTIIVAILAIALSGKAVETTATPPRWLTSVCATLLIATMFLVFSYGRFAIQLILEYSSPRSFIAVVVSSIGKEFRRTAGQIGAKVHISVLGQSLRYALRRDDSEVAKASLEGLEAAHEAYVSAATTNPDVRQYIFADGTTQLGWIGSELRQVFVEASEEALRLGAPQDELDWLLDHYGNVLYRSIRASHEKESIPLIDGLTLIGMSPYQVREDTRNYLARPVFVLAAGERVAEENCALDLAAHCLAAWSTVLVYFTLHLGVPHPGTEESQHQLGGNPPWDMTENLLSGDEWAIRWSNKLDRDALSFAVMLLKGFRIRYFDISQTEEQALRVDVYRMWVSVADSFATWAYDGHGPEEYKRRIDMVMAQVNLVGTSNVQLLIREFIDAIPRGLTAIQAVNLQDQPLDVHRQLVEEAFTEAMRPQRDRMVAAMEAEIGEALFPGGDARGPEHGDPCPPSASRKTPGR